LDEELHRLNVRFLLMRMIVPVRQMLEHAGVMVKIKTQDVYIGPTEAVLDYLSSTYDDAGIQELLRSGANSVQFLLQASLASAPPERRAALAAIAASVGQGLKPERDR
jgi:hypothetical protein